MLFIILICIVIFILIILTIFKYNKMLKYKNKVAESFSSVDVYLKQRFDLIPNLVNVVKGYSKHESEVLTKLTELRSKGLKSANDKDKVSYANKVIPEMKKLLILAEDYPDLKADKLYKDLMEELVLIEDKIAAARRFYDSNVTRYNTLIETFPNSLFASIFGFKKIELFEIEIGEKLNININL